MKHINHNICNISLRLLAIVLKIVMGLLKMDLKRYVDCANVIVH